jgi:hypothetical protein
VMWLDSAMSKCGFEELKVELKVERSGLIRKVPEGRNVYSPKD